MSVVRNVSEGPFVIGGKPAFHLLPGSAAKIPDSLLQTPQVKNLINMGLLKLVRIQEQAATVTKKTVKKTEVKKEEKKVEAVKKSSHERPGEKSEKTIEYKTMKKEGL